MASMLSELPTSDTHGLERLRAAGRVESWSMAQHNLNLYHSVAVSCYYSAPTTAAFELIVFAALSTVIKENPILCAIPVGEDTSCPYYARLPRIDLENVVIFSIQGLDSEIKDQKLDSILESLHNKSFKGNYGKQPFWQLLIIRGDVLSKDFVAIFVYHHAIGDGISGVMFHRSFLTALRADFRPLATLTVSHPKAELLPSLDEIHSLENNPAPPLKLDTTGLWTGEPIKSNPTTHFKSISIPKNKTDQFVKVCREKSSSITAAVQVLVATALFGALPKEYTQLHTSTLICIRRWLNKPIEQDSMGNFYDNAREYYQRAECAQFSWREAQRSKENMNRYLEAEGRYLGIQALKSTVNANTVLRSAIGKDRPYSFGISNLGYVGAENGPLDKSKQGWQRGRMVFSSSSPCMGSAFSITLITGADGCLVVGFTWAEGSLENKIIDQVVLGIKTGIFELSRGSVLP